MAEKNIAALLDSMACTIHVQYQHTTNDTEYTYICNLPEISVGDFVVVPTTDRDKPTPKYADYVKSEEGNAHISSKLMKDATRILTGQRLSIAKVVKIDDAVDIPPDDSIEYKWVVAKVDLTKYSELLTRNKEITTAVQTAYQRNIRKSFAERILGELPEADKDNLLKLLNK